MKPTSFWTYFSSGYGMLWLIVLGCSLLSQSHINTGGFGLIGFPIIAWIYASMRRSQDGKVVIDDFKLLSPNLRKFLVQHPEFIDAPIGLRERAFRHWLTKGSGK